MPRPVYSLQFFSGEFVGAASIDYTVPDDDVAIVRDVQGYVSDGLDAACIVALELSSTFPLQWNFPAGYAGSWSWEGRLAVPGGSTILISSDGSAEAVVQFLVSGYLLTA